MKKMKFAVCLSALAVVLGFSSCLNSDDSDYPDYQSSVTVTGDEMLGYKFYADNGSILVPTSQSAMQAPGLKKVKRAVIAFDLADSNSGQKLEPNKQYTIVLHPNYSQGIPTFNVINRYNNAAADTLVQNQDPIQDMSGLFVKNGYATLGVTFQISPTGPFYMNVGYESDKDVDVEGKTLTLHLYYDKKSPNAYQTVSSLFSFRMPESEMHKFSSASNDSINVVLKTKASDYGASADKELKCKMAVRDFMVPRY